MEQTVSFDIGNGRVVIDNKPSNALRLLGFDGIFSSTAAVTTQENNIIDGGIVSGVRTTMRRITIEFIALGMTLSEVSRLFPSRKHEVIAITCNGHTRYTYGYRDGDVVLNDMKSAHAPVMASVSFVCPDAFLFTKDTRTIGFADYSGGLQYPTQYPIGFGTLDNVSEIVCPNDGDYDAPFTLRFKTTLSGNVTIAVGSQTCSVLNLAAGSSVVLDTKNKLILVNGSKRFDLFSGAFPSIPVGGCGVDITGLSGSAVIEYQEAFEGA